MKPYSVTITGTESQKVYQALRRGLWCAKQHAKAGMIGADGYVRQIEAALEIMNRPCAGGYESEQEASAAALKSWADDAAAHNNN